MKPESQQELRQLIKDIYQSNKQALNQLLGNMQPQSGADVDKLNALVEVLIKNNDAFKIAADVGVFTLGRNIICKGELILTLTSKQDWVDRIPDELPEKRFAETRLFLDKNGNVLVRGKDFEIAEIEGTYPVNVYSLQSVSESIK